MKKHSSILLPLLLLAGLLLPTVANGQSETTMINVNVGGGAGGLKEVITGKVTTTYSDGKKETNTIGYDLEYQIMPLAQVGLEYGTGGFLTLFEGTYEKANYLGCKEYTNERFLLMDPESFQDVNILSGSAYIGVNLRNGRRLQFPILGGASLVYFNGAPINTTYIDFVYKVRARFYLTNSVGLFAGVSGGIGGTKLEDELPNTAPEPGMFDLASHPFRVEAGLSIMVGRKK